MTKTTMPRPKAIIDWEKVGKMFEAGAKVRGVCAQLGINEDTIAKRCRTDLNMDLAEFRQEKKAKGDQLLEQTQFQTAVGYKDPKGNWQPPNTTMLIWLGKQRLGQTDKTDVNQTVKRVNIEWVDVEGDQYLTDDGASDITDSIN
jgi:hypothetical protein